ncbi:MAG TPA: hypothetical protein VKZ57_01635 [Sphingobacterium sp.]|nr:hypothetical protein [Sphingobacterium sp.]
MELEGIDGLISLQMFSETDFVIDFAKKEITLTDLSKDEKSKSFDIQMFTHGDKSTDISTYITLNNKYRIQVILDSGAGYNSFWLSDKFISVLGMDKNELEFNEKKSEFNDAVVTKFYRGAIQSISNEFVTLEKPDVVFVEGLIYEGKTSINWFGNKLESALKTKKCISLIDVIIY